MNDTSNPSLQNAPLGRLFDQSIAQVYGLSVSAVRNERERQGIPKPAPTGMAKLMALLLKVRKSSTSWLARCEGRPNPSVRRDLAALSKMGMCSKDGSEWVASEAA